MTWKQSLGWMIAIIGTLAVGSGFGKKDGPTFDPFSDQPPNLPKSAIVINANHPVLFIDEYIYTSLNANRVRFPVGRSKPDKMVGIKDFTLVWGNKIVASNGKDIYVLDKNLKTVRTLPFENYGIPLQFMAVNENYLFILSRAKINSCSVISVYDLIRGSFLWHTASGYSCAANLKDVIRYDLAFDSASLEGKYIITHQQGSPPAGEKEVLVENLVDTDTGKAIAQRWSDGEEIHPELWKQFMTQKAFNTDQYWSEFNFNYLFSNCKLKTYKSSAYSTVSTYSCKKHYITITETGYGRGNNSRNFSYMQFGRK